MKFSEFIKGLDPAALEDYAKRADTTPGYITTHLASVPPRKIPREPLMRRLCQETGGKVSMNEMLMHFYGAAPERSGVGGAAA